MSCCCQLSNGWVDAGEDAHPGAGRGARRLGPGGDQFGAQPGEAVVDAGHRLQLRRGDLRVQVAAGLAGEHGLGERGAGGQPVGARIDEVELLLDAEGGAGRNRARGRQRCGRCRSRVLLDLHARSCAPRGRRGRRRRCPGTRGRLVFSRVLTVRPADPARTLLRAQGSAYQANPRPGQQHPVRAQLRAARRCSAPARRCRSRSRCRRPPSAGARLKLARPTKLPLRGCRRRQARTASLPTSRTVHSPPPRRAAAPGGPRRDAAATRTPGPRASPGRPAAPAAAQSIGGRCIHRLSGARSGSAR